MTPVKNLVRVVAIAIGAIYTGVLFLAGVELDTVSKQILGAIPAVAPLLVVVYDKWIWRWGFVQKLNRRPRVDGLWKGSLTPHSESHIPSGGNRGPIPIYVVIEQTCWTVSITQFTQESRSYSRTSTFLKHGQSNHMSLSFLYDNVPRQDLRWRSPRHVGACEFNTPQGAPTRLEGNYFTDRFTQGEMVLDFVDRSTNFADYQSADAHHAEVSSARP